MRFLTNLRHTLPLFLLTFLAAPIAHAATTPSLGAADTFAILAHAYVNSSTFTSLSGDLGYTVAPSVVPPLGSGVVHAADATYTQAVSDKNTALAALNAQICDFTFAPGTVDLATDTTHIPLHGSSIGVYTPGVYCISGSMTIAGGGTITLNGAGTYIFRPTGALTTSDSSHVAGSNGVSACDIFWTPGGSTILGAMSSFAGTVIEYISAAPNDITVGAHSNWVGRALDKNPNTVATVTTGVDVSIIAPVCGGSPPPATLHVIKTFYNDYGGTAVSADANLHVRNGAGEVSGSPHAGSATGTIYTLNADTYTVSEDAFPGYTAIFSGDCDATGHITLASGTDRTCTISNDQNPPTPATLHIVKHMINNNGGIATASSFVLHVRSMGPSGLSDIAGSPAGGAELPGTPYTALMPGAYVVSENTTAGYTQSFSGDCDASGNITLAAGSDRTCTITNDDIAPALATLHVTKHSSITTVERQAHHPSPCT